MSTQRDYILKSAIVQKYGSQAVFSQVIGKPQSYISQVVTAKIEPSDAEKRLWAKLLGKPVDDLFGVKSAMSAVDQQIWDQCAADWAKDPALAKEFGGRFETYFYFTRAEGKGLVRTTRKEMKNE